MPEVFVNAARSTPFTVPSGSVVKVTSLSAAKIVPTGTPSVWFDDAFQCTAGNEGWYAVTARIQWGSTFNAPVLLQARINNSTLVNLNNGPNNTSSSGAVQPGAANVRLEEGDTLDLRVRQLSGVDRNVTVEEFTVRWVAGL